MIIQKYKTAILALGFLVAGNLFSQDIHFSQYGFSPINTNPATTGFFDGDFRAGGIYRTQWWNVPVPYNTVSIFADTRMGQKKMKSDRLGLGFLFNNDVSGDSKYGTTQLYLPVSFVKKLNSDSTFIGSIALQPGISATGFKTNALKYETQYNGTGYDEALPSLENYNVTNQTKFDLNFGAFTQYNFIQRGYVQTGLSMYHLLPQKVSYFNNNSIKLDPKTNIYLLANYPVAGMLDAQVEVLYSRQGKFQELVAGANLKYIFETKHYQTIFAGAYLRPKDAFIARIGMEYKNWKYSMAYDVNTSGFKAATNKKGALEFALIYIMKKQIPFVAKKRVCPIYM
ncbi:MAG: PorP/SprF family type IX secretion system membrane protein [Bacteroidia bacterium]|nr:PorP/SprF family type IX secretion system membrane protein [Bacteroidia bacterium]